MKRAVLLAGLITSFTCAPGLADAQQTPMPPPAQPVNGALPAAAPNRNFIYGMTVARVGQGAMQSFDLVQQAGFTQAYVDLDWASMEPQPGHFAWDAGQRNDLLTAITAARSRNIGLIVRIGRPPAWAGPPAKLDPVVLQDYATALATYARGAVVGYEIFNEPNLTQEWGGPPDPSRYVRLLIAARNGIKRADPGAAVIAAGLAAHTGGAPGTMEDFDYLNGMYLAGARGQFDLLGIHPYGGNTPPATDPTSCGMCFRRAEVLRQIMLSFGDGQTSALATEFGYLQATDADLGQYNWLKLSPDRTVEYLQAAFAYARANWPWLRGMVVFNLDFDTVAWNSPQLGAYWFALLNPDGSPRPTYRALQAMGKPAS